MKRKALALLLIGVMCLTTACSQGNNKTKENSDTSKTVSASETEKGDKKSQNYPLKISTFNYAKEPVEETFEKAPERVITAWQNSAETMLALGLEDRIVSTIGVKEEDIAPSLKEAYKKIKDKEFNDFTDTNVAMTKEKAVMLKPDFILAWKSTFSDKSLGDVDYWHENNVNTYMALNSNDISEKRTVENEYEDIMTVGKIFDVEDKAKALVDDMKKTVEKVTKATDGKQKQKVIVLSSGKDNIRIYDKNNLAGDMVTKMGGELMETGPKISAEDLVTLNPDVIFTVHMEGYGEGAGSKALAEIIDNPVYGSLNAVKNKKVFPLRLSEVYTSGIRTIDGLNAIGEALYPELYKK